MKLDSKNRLNLTVFGVPFSYKPQNEVETERLYQLFKVLEIKSKHKKLNLEDVLETTKISGLSNEIVDNFNDLVKSKKIDSVLSLAVSIGLGIFVTNVNLPNTIEVIGYIGAIAGMTVPPLRYVQACLAGMYVNKYLK